ncbi:hypothetical protein LTR72_008129 [Exophiala xenobiotica]|nr:hypothetical protein LTR72_008129 [Exophiala xenobiotica]KAK5316505.1 hypothetical protein LTR93_009306 [Exophiala xenobiotica]KAK5412265.1 hypothetical protein LTR06_005235 [Exophiala xenobiotica]KAK5482049.1 hypothetical protein LTR55_006930 [Exophiala xenobiotica]
MAQQPQQHQQEEGLQQWTNEEADAYLQASGNTDGEWARRNVVWRANHRDQRPEVMNPQVFAEVRQLVGDFFATSQSAYMAALMLGLWVRADVPILFDEFVDSPGEARVRLERMAQPYWDLAGGPWVMYWETLDEVWAWDVNFPHLVRAPPPPPPPPPAAPVAPVAPGVVAGGHPQHNYKKTITGRDPNWLFICDVCGHAVLYQGEFNRHVRDGRAGAEGFRVVASNPRPGDERWYGEDNAGNRYEGDTVRVGTTGVNRGGPIPDPCGGNIRAKKAANRRR